MGTSKLPSRPPARTATSFASHTERPKKTFVQALKGVTRSNYPFSSSESETPTGKTKHILSLEERFSLFEKLNKESHSTLKRNRVPENGFIADIEHEIRSTEKELSFVQLVAQELVSRHNLLLQNLNSRREWHLALARKLSIIEKKGHVCNTCSKQLMVADQLIEHKKVHLEHDIKVAFRKAMDAKRSILLEESSEIVEKVETFHRELQALTRTPSANSPFMQKAERNMKETELEDWIGPGWDDDLDDDSTVDVTIRLLLCPSPGEKLTFPGVPSHTHLDSVRDKIALCLGLRSELVTLVDSATGATMDLTEKLSNISPLVTLGTALRIPYNAAKSSGNRVLIYGYPTGETSITVPSSVPNNKLSVAICSHLGIDPEFAPAWCEVPSPSGPHWCFTPSEKLIANSGWSKTQVDIGLLRGGVEWNPGPPRVLQNLTSPALELETSTGWTQASVKNELVRGGVEQNPGPDTPYSARRSLLLHSNNLSATTLPLFMPTESRVCPADGCTWRAQGSTLGVGSFRGDGCRGEGKHYLRFDPLSDAPEVRPPYPLSWGAQRTYFVRQPRSQVPRALASARIR